MSWRMDSVSTVGQSKTWRPCSTRPVSVVRNITTGRISVSDIENVFLESFSVLKAINIKLTVRDFGLPPRCTWNGHSSGMLRSVKCQFRDNLSVLLQGSRRSEESQCAISLIPKTNILNKIRPDCFEMGPICCRETPLKSYDSTLRKTPRECKSQVCCPLVRCEV